MKNLPQFITFTGADDFTDVEGMRELSDDYPVEWGVLFSPKRQGEGRYPTFEFVNKVRTESRRLALAAHICGGHSVRLLESGGLGPLEPLIAEGDFRRVQINTTSTVDTSAISQWAMRHGVVPILQCRDAFPADPSVYWLFDASGGRGLSPKSWPNRQDAALRGYAGGLSPQNVADAVGQFSTDPSPYWIDMETGVRDQDDRFSLELCRQVCEAVYGAPRV
jgi:hypothetical protein